MWLVRVSIWDRNGPYRLQSRIWHYALEEDAPVLVCGIKNPPWEMTRDQNGVIKGADVPGNVDGVRRCTEPTDRLIGPFDPEKHCPVCWPILLKDVACHQRAGIVAARMAEGKLEVTLNSVVTIRDSESGEEARFGFSPDLTDEIDMCSPNSPMADALIGSFVGDEITVSSPTGSMRYIIVVVMPHGR